MYEIKFLQALVWTILLEMITLYVLLRWFYKNDASKVGLLQIFECGILCSAATLPYVWFVFPAFIKSHLLFALTAEIFAISAESVILYLILKQSYKKSLVLALLCNLVSYLLGETVKII